jgi:hypothetical protein
MAFNEHEARSLQQKRQSLVYRPVSTPGTTATLSNVHGHHEQYTAPPTLISSIYLLRICLSHHTNLELGPTTRVN